MPGINVNGNNDNNKGNSKTIGNGDNVIPSDIKYYPGTDVNIEMRRLLDCERISLMEEEILHWFKQWAIITPALEGSKIG